MPKRARVTIMPARLIRSIRPNATSRCRARVWQNRPHTLVPPELAGRNPAASREAKSYTTPCRLGCQRIGRGMLSRAGLLDGPRSLAHGADGGWRDRRAFGTPG